MSRVGKISANMALIPALFAATIFATSSQADGLFTVHCQQLTVQRSDPVVMSGVPSGHVHNIVGGTRFWRNETATDAVNPVAATCDKPLLRERFQRPLIMATRPIVLAAVCASTDRLEGGVRRLQVPAPDEDVGLHGPLPALPGNNPVVGASPLGRLQRTSNVSAIVDQAIEENGAERLRVMMPRDGDGSDLGMLLKSLVE